MRHIGIKSVINLIFLFMYVNLCKIYIDMNKKKAKITKYNGKANFKIRSKVFIKPWANNNATITFKYLSAKFVNLFIIKNIKNAMIGINKYIAVINKVNSTVVISCVKKNVEAF